MVGTLFVPTYFGEPQRAGVAKDGRRSPWSGVRKAYVLDDFEHCGTNLAVRKGLLCLSAPHAPSFDMLGHPFSGKPFPASGLDGLQMLLFGFCERWQLS